MEETKPKEVQIEEIRFNVEKMCDKLGMPIDEGVKDAVVYLKALDFPTSSSCEGHLVDDEGNDLPRSPYVEVYPEEPEEVDWPDIPEIQQEMSAKAAELKERAQSLLDDFYAAEADVDPDAMLTLWQIAYGWRFEPVGTEALDHLSATDAEALLKKQQEEMQRFAEFLEKKFYGPEE